MDLRKVQEMLAGRTVGQLPVSVATSLAMEGAFGIYPERPVEIPPPITKYNSIWINVRTLMRNLLGALKPEDVDSFQPDYFPVALIPEMQSIESEVTRYGEGMVSVVFYLPNLAELPKVLRGASIKTPKTPKQEFTVALQHQGERIMLEAANGLIRETRIRLEGNQRSSLILTHHPVDLLSRYSFRQLDLLESHTGIIKTPALWYTKLTGGKELPPLPFNKFTLSLLGDNNNLINAQPIKVRRTVLEIANEKNWTAITSMDKIRENLKGIKDEMVRASVLALLS